MKPPIPKLKRLNQPSLFGIFFVSFLLLTFLPLFFIHLIENQTVGKYEQSLSSDLVQFINDTQKSEVEESLKGMGLNLELAFGDADRALQVVCTLYPFWAETNLNVSPTSTEANSKNVIVFSTKLTKLLFSVRSLSKYSSAFLILNQNNEIVTKEPANSPILGRLPVGEIVKSLSDSADSKMLKGGTRWIHLSDFGSNFSGYLLAMRPFRVNGEKNHALIVFNLNALLRDITPVPQNAVSSYFILDPFWNSVILFSRTPGGQFNTRRLPLKNAKVSEKRIFQKILGKNENGFSGKSDSFIYFTRRLKFFSWRLGLLSHSDAYFLPIEAKWKTYDQLRKKSVKQFKYFAFFLALLLLGMSGLMARFFQQPLQRLINAAQSIKDGHIQQKLSPGRIREFSQLITAFNEMSAKLHSSLQELAYSENRYRMLVEEAAEAVLVFSPDGKIIAANHACAVLLGIPSDELAQKNAAEIFSTPLFLELVTEEKMAIPLELTHLRPDGKVLFLQVKLAKIELQEGLFYQAIVHDLTQQKEYEEKLLEQNRFLSFTNEITGSILSRSTLEEIYETSLHSLMEIQNAVIGLIYLYDSSSKTFSLAYSLGVDEKWMEEIRKIDKHSLSYEAIRYKKPIYIENIISDSRLSPNFKGGILKERGVQSYIGIPLLLEDIPFGVISLGLPGNAHLSQNKKRFFHSIGTQMGLIIRYFTSMQLETKRATQLALLTQGLEIWTETGNFHEVLQKSVDFIYENMGYWHVSVFLLDKKANKFRLEAIAGGFKDLMKDGYFQEFGRGIISQVIKSKQTYYASNAEKDPYYFKFQGLQAKSELAVPLRLHGKVIGVVNIEEMEYDAFDLVDIATIEAFSNQLSLYYGFDERIRLQKMHAQQMDFLSSMGALMNSKLDSTDFIREVVDGIRKTYGYFLVSVYLVSPEDKNSLIKVADSGGTPSKWPIGKKVPIGQGLLGLAAKTKEIVCVNNVAEDPRFVRVGEALAGSELCVPILLHGQFLGVLNIETMETEAFREFEIHALQTLANQLAQAMHNARLYEQLKYEKEKMDQILSEMDEGIAMTDFKGEILYLNPVFKDQFPKAGVGKNGGKVFPFWEILKGHPDFESLWSGNKKSLLVEFPYRGKIFLVTVSQFLDFDFSKYFLFLVKDITEMKQYELEKIKGERLSLAVEMAGSIAHEINQPLTGILGYLALIKEDLNSEDPLIPDLEKIEGQAERISELVKKFQRVVKIRTKTYVGTSKIIDLEQSTQNNQGDVL